MTLMELQSQMLSRERFCSRLLIYKMLKDLVVMTLIKSQTSFPLKSAQSGAQCGQRKEAKPFLMNSTPNTWTTIKTTKNSNLKLVSESGRGQLKKSIYTQLTLVQPQ